MSVFPVNNSDSRTLLPSGRSSVTSATVAVSFGK
jgi:hypothetical protein